jgi:hypothetical protein
MIGTGKIQLLATEINSNNWIAYVSAAIIHLLLGPMELR